MRHLRKIIIHSLIFTIFLMIISLNTVSAQMRDWNSDLDPSTTEVESCMVDGVPTLKCLEVVFGNVLFMSNAFIILVLFIMFVYGSITYLTSLGEEAKIQKAQGTFKFGLIGLVLYASSYLILKTIDCLFLKCNGTLFNFTIPGP